MATGTTERGTFEHELAQLVNKHSLEGGSNTPDFILAQFLATVLAAWNYAVKRREDFYGRGPTPVPVALDPNPEMMRGALRDAREILDRAPKLTLNERVDAVLEEYAWAPFIQRLRPLEELAAKWRQHARDCSIRAADSTDSPANRAYHSAVSQRLQVCADNLDAVRVSLTGGGKDAEQRRKDAGGALPSTTAPNGPRW